MPKFVGVTGRVDSGELVNFLRARRRFGEGLIMQGGCVRARGRPMPRAQQPEGLTQAADIARAKEDEVENGEIKR